MAQSQTPTLNPGTKLAKGNYTIQRLLGIGGFGAVYLAVDQQGQACAVKQCTDLSTESKMQFGHEIAVQRMLHHPLFPRVYDEFVGKTPGATGPNDPDYPFVAMEYVPGQSLESLLEARIRQNQGPFSEQEVIFWILQLLEGLDYAHSKDVVHRDVKPSNVMLLPDGKTIKVLDLGIAKIGGQGTATQRGARGVSPGFSPPEQYAQAGQTASFSDVYAVGATLYYLLTHQAPLEAPSRISGQSLTSPRQLNSKISRNVEAVILQSMAMDKAARFQTAGEMKLALQGKSAVQMQACPNCGKSMKTTAKFCPHCGHSSDPLEFIKARVTVQSIPTLVKTCDSHWQEAVSYLATGTIEKWLQGQAMDGARLLQALQSARAQYPKDPNAQLESLLQVADPRRVPPQLQVQPAQPGSVTLEQGASHTIGLTIANAGKGYLFGSVTTSDPWLTVRPNTFQSMGGKAQSLSVVIDSAALNGSRSGRHYPAQVSISSNGGNQAVSFQVMVTATPRLDVSTTRIDFGNVPFGQTPVENVRVGNSGAGVLNVKVYTRESWLQATPDTLALARRASEIVKVQMDSRQLGIRGDYQGVVTIDGSNDGSATVQVLARLSGPASIRRAPGQSVDSIEDLIAWCDLNWAHGIGLLRTGELVALARYVGRPQGRSSPWKDDPSWEQTLAMIDQTAKTLPEDNRALETALRSLGAKPPKWTHNWGELESKLGMGLFPDPRWFWPGWKGPGQVIFSVENKGPRGYLYGTLRQQVPWLQVTIPEFGCLPNHRLDIPVLVDKSQRKGGGWSQALLDLVVAE